MAGAVAAAMRLAAPGLMGRHILQDYSSMGGLVDSFLDVPVSVADFEEETNVEDYAMDYEASSEDVTAEQTTAVAGVQAGGPDHGAATFMLMVSVMAGMALVVKFGYPKLKRVFARSQQQEYTKVPTAPAPYGTFAPDASEEDERGPMIV